MVDHLIVNERHSVTAWQKLRLYWRRKVQRQKEQETYPTRIEKGDK